ncbi:hypothetical protein [Bifidobacterium sp.]|uniref:hypothetical protein n=1 Tax=Bifidobacterium sp. TaxID=41200 RepID=UPI0039E92920
MGNLSYAVNGQTLENDHVTVTQGTMWIPSIGVESTMLKLPGTHGAVTGGLPVIGERTLPLKLHVHGAVESQVSRLLAIFAAPELTITRHSDAGLLSARASLASLAVSETSHPDLWADIEVQLSLPDVFWHGTAQSLTVTRGGVQPLDVSGDAPVTDAIIRVAKAASVQVTDPASGTGISWTGTTPSKAYLYIDAGNLAAWASDSVSQWSKGGDDVSGGVGYPSAGPLQICRDTPGYRLLVTGSGSALVRLTPAFY